MAGSIEVRVAGRGVVRGDEASPDAATRAACSLCGGDADAVASVSTAGATSVFACAPCLRERLDALSVGRWRMREASAGLPWGKVSG